MAKKIEGQSPLLPAEIPDGAASWWVDIQLLAQQSAGMTEIMPAQAGNGIASFKKFDEVRRACYLYHLSQGVPKCLAGKSVGVCNALVCLFRNANSWFANVERCAQMEANATVENALFQQARGGDRGAALAWLCNRMPERWKDMRRVTLSMGEVDAERVRAELDRLRRMASSGTSSTSQGNGQHNGG